MEAEDIMQESFLTAFDKISTFKGDATFGAWLKRIVINNSIDSVKKTDVLNFSEEITDRIGEASVESEPDESEDFNAEQIHKAINQLPDGYRVIVSLYLLEGYDHEEISQIVGITSSTSRSQYNRGKNKLKEMLTKSLWETN